MEQVADIIKEAIANVKTIEGVVCDRSHFQTFGASALVFETVYYVPSPDYVIYMNVQQEINLALLKKFKDVGIEFAYPTQKIFTVPV